MSRYPPRASRQGMTQSPRQIQWGFFLLLLGAFCTTRPVLAEIHLVNKALFPGDSGVVTMDDTIQGQGEIDLSKLQFTAIADPKNINGPPKPFLNLNDTMTGDAKFFIDVLVFRTDPSCLQTKAGCRWLDYGIGAVNDYTEFHFCCSAKLQGLGMCNHTETGQPATPLGHLVLDKSVYKGVRAFVPFDGHGGLQMHKLASRPMPINETGTYVVLLANCNEEVHVKAFVRGAISFESKHGYLPGYLYKFLWFYVSMSVLYLVLASWFGWALKRYGSLAVEYTVLWALVLGLCESILLSSDLALWNGQGTRVRLVAWLAMLVDVLQQGLTMAVVSIIATGRGLTGRVFGVGLTYIVVSLTRAVLVFYYEDKEAFFMFPTAHRYELSIFVLTQLVLVMDIGIVVWVLWSLQSTLSYLKQRNETQKLGRYYQFRCLLSVVLLFSILVVLLNLGGADKWGDDDTMPREWILTVASTLNVLVVLLGVALLWRPSPDNKVFGTVYEENESDENEIELRPTSNGGFRDDRDEDHVSEGSVEENDIGLDEADEKYQEKLPVEVAPSQDASAAIFSIS